MYVILDQLDDDNSMPVSQAWIQTDSECGLPNRSTDTCSNLAWRSPGQHVYHWTIKCFNCARYWQVYHFLWWLAGQTFISGWSPIGFTAVYTHKNDDSISTHSDKGQHNSGHIDWILIAHIILGGKQIPSDIFIALRKDKSI